MKRYVANELITVAAGTVLYFDDKQAADRGARIERLDKGKYKARELLQLKRGEEFGLDGELPKTQARRVSPAENFAKRTADLLAGGAKA